MCAGGLIRDTGRVDGQWMDRGSDRVRGRDRVVAALPLTATATAIMPVVWCGWVVRACAHARACTHAHVDGGRGRGAARGCTHAVRRRACIGDLHASGLPEPFESQVVAPACGRARARACAYTCVPAVARERVSAAAAMHGALGNACAWMGGGHAETHGVRDNGHLAENKSLIGPVV